MRKSSFYPYFILLIIVFGAVNMSLSTANHIRAKALSIAAPAYQVAGFFRSMLLHAPTLRNYNEHEEKRVTMLLSENQNLRSQLEGMYEWLLFDGRVEEQIKRLEAVQKQVAVEDEIYWRDFFQRRAEELRALIEMQTQAVAAKVIFREPNSWSSSIWIDVGEEDNERMGRSVISKDSPVILGKSLIGVVEFVEKHKSRVRLLTDSGLTPSVRASRGGEQNIELADHIEALLIRLKARDDLEVESLCLHLEECKHKLEITRGSLLAKGELRGSSEPLWRARSLTLQGVGFNYDYSDKEGPARDLRTGEAEGASPVEIIKRGDLLVTTGFDGVFPAGLHVAIVTKVHPLKDGEFAYGLEARPSAELQELSAVFVLPKVVH